MQLSLSFEHAMLVASWTWVRSGMLFLYITNLQMSRTQDYCITDLCESPVSCVRLENTTVSNMQS